MSVSSSTKGNINVTAVQNLSVYRSKVALSLQIQTKRGSRCSWSRFCFWSFTPYCISLVYLWIIRFCTSMYHTRCKLWQWLINYLLLICGISSKGWLTLTCCNMGEPLPCGFFPWYSATRTWRNHLDRPDATAVSHANIFPQVGMTHPSGTRAERDGISIG